MDKRKKAAFAFTDLLVVLAILALLVSLLVPVIAAGSAKSRKTQCMSNLKEITQAVLLYANDNRGTLPNLDQSMRKDVWWWYKDLIKAQVKPKETPIEKLFACPSDRGYSDAIPFYRNSKFASTSYVFNGVNLPGMPNVAGRTIGSIHDPNKTLLVMEWCAHAPLSWHKSRTGRKNQPFYNDAESMVGFADGKVDFIKIYYDGISPAFTRDPIAGYDYKYSGD